MSSTLFLGGDVMTGRGIDQVLPCPSDPVLYEKFIRDARDYVELAESRSGPITEPVSYKYIWADALAELEAFSPDARIINLETSLTTSDEPWPQKGIHYRMHPGNAAVLVEAGIDVCVLGNNHILDWGYNGLKETIEILRNNGLTTTGAGMYVESAASPAIVNMKNGRLLVFSYGFPDAGVPVYWGAKHNKPGVNLLKSMGARELKKVKHDTDKHRLKGDLILISLHWGGNWGYEVSASHKNFARQLIDYGIADIIHGHSSHHPKGIEVYRERLILYGCGDLINDYEGIRGHDTYRVDLPCMYFPTLDAAGALISLYISPMTIRRFRLHRAGGEDLRWMAGRLNRECEKFGTSIELTKNGRLELHWN